MVDLMSPAMSPVAWAVIGAVAVSVAWLCVLAAVRARQARRLAVLKQALDDANTTVRHLYAASRDRAVRYLEALPADPAGGQQPVPASHREPARRRGQVRPWGLPS